MEQEPTITPENGEQEICLENEPIQIGGDGGGAVLSVNGKTGNVWLKTSDLNNDSGYQTAEQVDSTVAEAIQGVVQFDFVKVDTLPEAGVKGTIYLVPNSGTAPNIYDEYIWVTDGFEKIGTTEIDLSGYAKTANLATVATSGSYTDLTNKPTIPEEYELPVATDTTLGGVKVGDGLSVEEDGTLSATGGGGGGTTGYTELTEADYNWPETNPDGIAYWLLDPGIYKFNTTGSCKLYQSKTSSVLGYSGQDIVILHGYSTSYGVTVRCVRPVDSSDIAYWAGRADGSVLFTTNYRILNNDSVQNSLTWTSSGGYPLDARQGKVLNDKITALEARVAALEG